jgi:tetratricopeptide (TPR) repeat protein
MPTQTTQAQEERIRGVFSSQEIRKVGTGTTTQKTVQKVFWYVEQDESGDLKMQALSGKYIPIGPSKTITKEELLGKYSPEPEFYIQSVRPKMTELNKSVDKGDQHRERGETFSAELEYNNALSLDEENVRANFGIGLTYLSRGEVDKADNIFGRLVKLDAAFDDKHKFLFNDFGMNLRKNKMLKQAVDYYTKAIELTKSDENLYLNIARAQLELKDINNCLDNLLKALTIAPQNEVAIKFAEWVSKKGLIPKELQPNFVQALSAKNAPPAKSAPAEPDAAT